VKKRLKQVGAALGALAALWLLGLLVAGFAARGCVKRRAERRLRASMQAEVSIGAVELSLLRGRLGFDRLHLERRGRGLLRIDIAHAETAVWPLGLVVVQPGLGALSARDVDLEITALAALDLGGGRRAPLRFDRLELTRLRLALEATSVLPGLARVNLAIDHVVVGPTTLRTPLSWVFGLRELRAHLELSTGGTAELDYRGDGKLRITGPLFGPRTLVIDFVIPALDPEHELEQLAALARKVGAELARQAGKGWLWDQAKKQLIDRVTP